MAGNRYCIIQKYIVPLSPELKTHKIILDMKRTILFLAAVIMLGVAMPTMAQQKKTQVKRTATTKKSGSTTALKKAQAKPTAVSIPFEGPALVDNHVAFLGISLAEKPAIMKEKLIAKGFQSKRNESGSGDLEVKGIVDGVQVRIVIGITSNNTIWNVVMYDAKEYKLPKAKARFETLIKKLESIYGKGEYTENNDYQKTYDIKMKKGGAAANMFNMDEMDGASEFYVVNVGFSEN